MSKIEIVKAGITSLETDALVNAANESLWEGGGVCGIIFKAAGSQELQAACNAIGGCKTGSAVITPGYKLKSKYIIHAVGPRWTDGKHDEPRLLYNAYKQSLNLAVQNGCKSIGFPLISAGIFGYPVDKAWRKAIQACLDFQKANPDADLDIQFAVIDDKILSAGKRVLAELNKEKTTLYLKQLDDDSLQRIRQRISKESDLLIDKKAHPMVGGLMDVICDSKVISNLSVDQMMKVIESIFPEFVLEEGWLAKYGDLLLRIIDAAKKKKPETRAEKYEKHLREILVPALKAGSRSGDVLDDLETLVDAYKVTTCLFRYYTEKDSEFAFEADLTSMEKLNQSIQNIKGTGNQLLGIVFVPVRVEERQYATFMSWLLEELLCKQETQEVGGDF